MFVRPYWLLLYLCYFRLTKSHYLNSSFSLLHCTYCSVYRSRAVWMSFLYRARSDTWTGSNSFSHTNPETNPTYYLRFFELIIGLVLTSKFPVLVSLTEIYSTFTRAVPKFCEQAAFLNYLTSLTNKTLTTSKTNNFQ